MRHIYVFMFLCLTIKAYPQFCNGEYITQDTVEICQVGKWNDGFCYNIDYGQKKRFWKAYLITDGYDYRQRFKSPKEAIAYIGGQLLSVMEIETCIERKKVYKVKLTK